MHCYDDNQMTRKQKQIVTSRQPPGVGDIAFKMPRLLLAGLLIILFKVTTASNGDRSDYFRSCLNICMSDFCSTGEFGIPSDDFVYWKTFLQKRIGSWMIALGSCMTCWSSGRAEMSAATSACGGLRTSFSTADGRRLSFSER